MKTINIINVSNETHLDAVIRINTADKHIEFTNGEWNTIQNAIKLLELEGDFGDITCDIDIDNGNIATISIE